ncbi:CsbD family protein [Sphingomonas bacterium]|uniref:CsbD family protein n=1 Tax=Sphingomonas bacterium TaxID=1895847 RepID=UPI001575C8AE|nr:CsbD family protein [Sphingomonas bacterium]
MNNDTLEGQGTNVAGQIKEVVGKATGDEQLQGAGLADQWSGIAQNGYGKLRDFARNRPFAAGVLGMVVGVALLNTLRGKK